MLAKRHKCPGCGVTLKGHRSDAKTCGRSACRMRAKRKRDQDDGYVVTAEDRAAMARVAAACPLPLPLLTDEDYAEHRRLLVAQEQERLRR